MKTHRRLLRCFLITANLVWAVKGYNVSKPLILDDNLELNTSGAEITNAVNEGSAHQSAATNTRPETGYKNNSSIYRETTYTSHSPNIPNGEEVTSGSGSEENRTSKSSLTEGNILSLTATSSSQTVSTLTEIETKPLVIESVPSSSEKMDIFSMSPTMSTMVTGTPDDVVSSKASSFPKDTTLPGQPPLRSTLVSKGVLPSASNAVPSSGALSSYITISSSTEVTSTSTKSKSPNLSNTEVTKDVLRQTIYSVPVTTELSGHMDVTSRNAPGIGSSYEASTETKVSTPRPLSSLRITHDSSMFPKTMLNDDTSILSSSHTESSDLGLTDTTRPVGTDVNILASQVISSEKNTDISSDTMSVTYVSSVSHSTLTEERTTRINPPTEFKTKTVVSATTLSDRVLTNVFDSTFSSKRKAFTSTGNGTASVSNTLLNGNTAGPTDKPSAATTHGTKSVPATSTSSYEISYEALPQTEIPTLSDNTVSAITVKTLSNNKSDYTSTDGTATQEFQTPKDKSTKGGTPTLPNMSITTQSRLRGPQTFSGTTFSKHSMTTAPNKLTKVTSLLTPTTTQPQTSTYLAQLGHSCKDGTDCKDIPNARCKEGKCACDRNYYNFKRQCQRKSKYQEKCSANQRCGSRLVCDGSVCQCKEKTSRSNVTEMCVTIPGTPKSLKVQEVNKTCLTVVWKSKLPEGVLIRIQFIRNFTTDIQNVNGNISTICDLLPGEKLSIVIAKVKHDVIGPNVSIETNTVPNVPKDLLVSIKNKTCIQLQWKLTGYVEEFRIDWVVSNTSYAVDDHLFVNKTFTYNVCGLKPGNRYVIEVSSIKGARSSLPTQITDCTCPVISPGSLQVYNKTSRSIYLRWNPNNLFTCTDEYRVDVKTEDGDFVSSSTKNSSFTDTALKNLEAGTDYTITLTLVTSGCGNESETIREQTKETVPGEIILSSVMCNVTKSSAAIMWSPPEHPNGRITEYIVLLTLFPAYKNFTFRTNTTDINITGLFPHSTYEVRIAAINNAGQGPLSSSKQFKTNEAAPQKPTDVRVKVLSPTSVNVTWSLEGRLRGNTSFSVVTRNLIQNTSSTFVCLNQELFCTITGLLPFWNYTFAVIAETRVGQNQSKESSPIRTEESAPQKPTDVTVNVLSPKSVNVTWALEGRLRGNTNFSVLTRDLIQNTSDTFVCSVQELFCTITGLRPFWNYTFSVIAATRVGQSQSNESSRITTEESVPGEVTSLTVIPEMDVTKPRSIFVSWQSPPREVHNGVLRGYTLMWQCGQDKKMEKTFVSSRQIPVTPDTECNVTVFARTAVGKGLGTDRKVYVKPGAPPYPKESIRMSQMPATFPQRQIVLNIPRMNESNGQVQEWGVIVSRYSQRSLPNKPYRGSKEEFIKWAQTNYQRNNQPYIAINETWHGQSATGENNFVVGELKRSECRPKGQHYCNWYLHPGQKYRFKTFVCSSTGCTESKYSIVMATDQADADNTSLIIGIVAAFILVALSGVLAGVLYKIWKKRSSTKPRVRFNSTCQTIGGKDFEMAAEAKKTRPVKIQNFSDHVDQMHRDSNLGFSEEYKILKQLSPRYATKAAEQQACRTKNRYTNVLPFDSSRVKLLPQDDEEGSDYINASFVNGYNCKREYIAAQGPLPCTKDEFWRMIWEYRVTIVVMLTQCMERGKIKCEKYWPDNTDPVYFGDLIVQLRSESVLPDYVIRIIDVKQGNKKRVVKHFHFLRWPDFGCPEKTWLLLNFVSAVRAHMPHSQEGPTLVHCSAGVGRTGTFISVDYLLQHIKEHNEIDVFGFVLEMREYRPLMVQTEPQYVYIHDCIRDALTEDTDDESMCEEDECSEPIYQNA